MPPSPPPSHGTSTDSHPIPAWKRIGLKLKSRGFPLPALVAADAHSKKRKYDDAAAEDTSLREKKNEEGKGKDKKSKKQKRNNEDSARKEKRKKRKFGEDEAPTTAAHATRGSEMPAKKRKSEKENESKSSKKLSPTSNGSTHSEAFTTVDGHSAALVTATAPSPPLSASTPTRPTKSVLKTSGASTSPEEPPCSLPRRKSVTFASDVKTKDGNSIKRLYLALDPFGKNRTRGGVSPPVNKPHSSSKDDTSPAKKKKQQQKKKKRGGGSNSNNSTTPYIDYIITYHQHRAAWKFEKSKQNWILRNALDTDAVSRANDEALAAYVRGLQAAGAKRRLLGEAKLVLGDEAATEEAQARAGMVKRALTGEKEGTDNENGSRSSLSNDERSDKEDDGSSSSSSSSKSSESEGNSS